MNNINAFFSVCKQFTPVTWICLAYLFFSHIPRTAAVVNTLTGFMVVAMVVLLIRREISIPWRSSQVRSVLALMTIIVVGVIVSPYWRESVVYLRREVLPLTLMILLLLGQKRQHSNPEALGRGIIGTIVLVYVARTVLAALNWWQQGFQYDSYSINRATAPFVDFYAVDSTLLMPIALGVFLYWPLPKKAFYLLGAVLVLGIGLVGMSAVRTALMCVMLVTFFQLFPYLWKRKLLAGSVLIAAVLFGGIVFQPQIERLAPRYLSVFSEQTYKTDASLVERYAIWKGTYELIQERPLLGYGLGWQKMTQVIHQEGFYERWKSSPDELMNTWAVKYFVNGPGGENPHNLVLQILFEAGLLGLVCYLWVLSTIVIAAINCWPRRLTNASANAYVHMVSAYALAYIVINLMNGFWLSAGSTMALLMAGYLFTRPLNKVQGSDPTSQHL